MDLVTFLWEISILSEGDIEEKVAKHRRNNCFLPFSFYFVFFFFFPSSSLLYVSRV